VALPDSQWTCASDLRQLSRRPLLFVALSIARVQRVIHAEELLAEHARAVRARVNEQTSAVRAALLRIEPRACTVDLVRGAGGRRPALLVDGFDRCARVAMISPVRGR
jgi:hypothetical protein